MQALAAHPKERAALHLVFGTGAILRGLAYIDPPSTGLTTFVDGWLPLHVWAAVWICGGVAIFAGIRWREIGRWAIAFTASLWALWTISFLWAWAVGDSSRGWVTAGALGTIAATMYIIARIIHPPIRQEPDE